MRLGIGPLAGLVLFLTGCGYSEGSIVYCDPAAPYLLTVHVQHAVTQVSLVDGARGAAHGTGGVDSLARVVLTGSDTALAIASLPSGRYTIQVERAGYQPWEQRNVFIVRDDCGTVAVALVAKLTPQ